MIKPNSVMMWLALQVPIFARIPAIMAKVFFRHSQEILGKCLKTDHNQFPILPKLLYMIILPVYST
jgi:hypothetical protein